MTTCELMKLLEKWGDDVEVLIDIDGEHFEINESLSGWDTAHCRLFLQAGERQ